jgi:hypothetical protein
MKKSIGSINSSMWDARNIINQISPQVENISVNLSSINSLIAEQKRRTEEDLYKKTKLKLVINDISSGVETEPYRQKIRLSDFYIQNQDSIYTQVHLLKLIISDSLDFYSMRFDHQVHDKEKHLKEVLYRFESTPISPYGFIYTYIDFEFVNRFVSLPLIMLYITLNLQIKAVLRFHICRIKKIKHSLTLSRIY